MKKYFVLIMIIMFTKLFSFSENEKLEFKIRYGFINAGNASLTLSKVVYRDSIDVIKISAKTRTNSFFDKIFKIRDSITSHWDSKNRISYEYSKNLREGSYKQKRIHYYYPELNLSYYIKYKPGTNTSTKEKKMKIPDNTQDILSAFYDIRSRDLEVGKDEMINVVADGEQYTVKVLVHKIEKIKTIFGLQKCFVIEPILTGEAIFKQTGKIKIWITADKEKIPVKLQSKIIFGSFYAELKDAENVIIKKK